ncbi:MAG TPA: glycosyltransferase family 4 protein, partial [Vicinamibacterales bacterium]|nr:glycosyltransferase family 4 protein [Vicinamibacterales bacterium]
GNAACHDYMWGYLFRYPGLVVLHDAQVHQARAQGLLRRYRPRRDDYLAEFAANHLDAPPDLGLLVAAGLGGSLFAHWPHIRLVLQAARLAAVHSPALAAQLRTEYGPDVAAVPMGVADPLASAATTTPGDLRRRYDLPADALVVGAFGGVTPEKRLPQLLEALAALGAAQPHLHLLVVGAPVAHYDVLADAAAHGIESRVRVTGFVSDAELPAHLALADICACLRWPTNGETSASWLRAVAAGRPTIITDLSHQPELPVVDPRSWQPLGPAGEATIALAVPILDEAHALRCAIEGLARSAERRRRLGDAARRYWQAHHTLEAMADAYSQLLVRAAGRAVPAVDLPAHLTANVDASTAALLDPFGLTVPAAVRGDRR